MSKLLSEYSYPSFENFVNDSEWFPIAHKGRANSQIDYSSFISKASTSPTFRTNEKWISLASERSDMFEAPSMLWNDFPLMSNSDIKFSSLTYPLASQGEHDLSQTNQDSISQSVFIPRPTNIIQNSNSSFLNKDIRTSAIGERSTSAYFDNKKTLSEPLIGSDQYQKHFSKSQSVVYNGEPSFNDIIFNERYNHNIIKTTQNLNLIQLLTNIFPKNNDIYKNQISSNQKEVLLEILERLKRMCEHTINKVMISIENVEINSLPESETLVELLWHFYMLSSYKLQEPVQGSEIIPKMENPLFDVIHPVKPLSQGPQFQQSPSHELLKNIASGANIQKYSNSQLPMPIPSWSAFQLNSSISPKLASYINEPNVESHPASEVERDAMASSSSNSGIIQNNYDVAAHETGKCKPCAFFYNKKKGCKNGSNCLFCHHEDHARHTLKQWKKHQKLLEEQAKANGEKEGSSKGIKEQKPEPPSSTIPQGLEYLAPPNLKKFQSNNVPLYPALEVIPPDHQLRKLTRFPTK